VPTPPAKTTSRLAGHPNEIVRNGGYSEGSKRRVIGFKELAELFEVDLRQVRRWANQKHLFNPSRRGGSCRVQDIPYEEIVRLACNRWRVGRLHRRDVAGRLGVENLLDFAKAEWERVQVETESCNAAGSRRHRMNLHLLAGIAPKDLSAAECEEMHASARRLLTRLLASPASSAHLMRAWAEALVLEASSASAGHDPFAAKPLLTGQDPTLGVTKDQVGGVLTFE
jgi:hypothetical protein